MQKCDVLVIGGGPAGASLAYYLAKKNLRVVLAEKKKYIDRPVRCAEFVPANITGLFDFKISGINNQVRILETYCASSKKEKFRLFAQTAAPGFILDRDIFVNDIVSKYENLGGKLLKCKKAVAAKHDSGYFIVALRKSFSQNYSYIKTRIIAGADGPLSFTGKLISVGENAGACSTACSTNTAFMYAIQQNPAILPNQPYCHRVFFCPLYSMRVWVDFPQD
ncbi:MAG: FAD-dependent monooxygenase [Actinobacteria bacterium]|nr:FAD-dependent monooxygenase [Actinomycetota bacterium]